MRRSIILVGLPGSGKTSVGRLVAARWNTPFTDIDEQVELVAGHSVAEIFRRSGEAEFRRLERAAMDRALDHPPHLISAGAGWIAQPGSLEAARARGALVVYLRVSPAIAAARLGAGSGRPLLDGHDPEARLEELLTARRHWYDQAEAHIDAAGSVQEVADRLEVIVPDPERV